MSFTRPQDHELTYRRAGHAAGRAEMGMLNQHLVNESWLYPRMGISTGPCSQQSEGELVESEQSA